MRIYRMRQRTSCMCEGGEVLVTFYFLYPSMYGKRRDKRDKLRCFEHPMQVIAAGFDPSSEPAKILDKDYTSGPHPPPSMH
jgi:hypothetical protein